MDIHHGFGEMLRDARLLRGWTQGELADRIDMALTTVSNWENERVRPSIEQGNRLIVTLGLPADVFWQQMGAMLTAPAATRLPHTLVRLLLELPPSSYPAIERTVRGELALLRQEEAPGASSALHGRDHAGLPRAGPGDGIVRHTEPDGHPPK